MEKVITVKGSAALSVKPDLTILSLTLETRDLDYKRCINNAGRRCQSLSDALIKGGFQKDEIKTNRFDITSEYHYKEYKKIFDGWKCTQTLVVRFPLDIKRLQQVLHCVADSRIENTTDTQFTVSDPSAIGGELLAQAAVNARKKAEILCSASGAKLGELLRIDYNWGEIDIYSHTRLEDCSIGMAFECPSAPEVDPEDIDVRDTATFVWSIV